MEQQWRQYSQQWRQWLLAMGNGSSLADNQEITHQSGTSRLVNSIFMAVCVAPLLMLAMSGLLGWNERRAVCDEKALTAGAEVVQQVGCTDASAGSGSLIMFSCDIQQEKLPVMQLGSSDFSAVEVHGTGWKVESSMYQCIEEEHKETKKDKVGGGETTVHTYTYSTGWASYHINSARFHKKDSESFRHNCDADNPPWDSAVPHSGSKYQQSMLVGAFTTTLTDRVPLNTPVSNAAAPSGWRQTSTGSFYRSPGHTSGTKIGDVKVALYTNDPSRLRTTVLGENSNGKIDAWTAPSSWLCSGFRLYDLHMGALSKNKLFETLSSEANVETWICRLVGFGFMWLAFFLCFGPLEVATDCIPCIGPCLGDSIHAIGCCISCLPATACTLGVAGLVWVVMRPMVGLPLILVWVLVVGGFGSYIVKKRREKQGGRVVMAGPGIDAGSTGLIASTQMSAPPVAMSVVTAQPVIAQPVQQRQMQVQVPDGSGAGQLIQFQTPDGNMMSATVPQGLAHGDIFMVNY